MRGLANPGMTSRHGLMSVAIPYLACWGWDFLPYLVYLNNLLIISTAVVALFIPIRTQD